MSEEKLTLTSYKNLGEASEKNGIPEGVKIIGAPNFWRQGRKGENITIAVIDTGCDINHPNLKDRIVGVRNFTNDDEGNVDKVTDYIGHGTHVAGIIAANESNNGVVGVAPKANLLILKALSNGGGNYSWVINAINYSVDKKVNIISMSLGGKFDDCNLHLAIQNAIKNNILVVCAAGNDGDNNPQTVEISYPAAYSEVISVGSINTNKKTSKFSASNDQIDLVAPGQGINNEGILSTAPGGKFVEMQGTSMATPHVAGALALIINWAEDEFKRKLTETEIYAQLIKKTIPLGYDRSIEGNGMIFLGIDEFINKAVKNSGLLNEILK